jgi:L-asparagine oxygenase
MSKAISLQSYSCSPEEAKRLRTAFDSYVLSHGPSTSLAIADAAARWRSAASPALRRRLARLADGRDAALLIHELPFDESIVAGLLAPEVVLAPKPDRLSEGLLLGAASQVGHPFGVSSEGAGVVNNLCPVRVSRDAVTGLGSRLPLDQHIENAVLRRLDVDQATDGLALICLSADSAGDPETVVADARLAFMRLAAVDQATLRANRFRINLPVRWRRPDRDDRLITSIAAGFGKDMTFAFAFYGDMVEATDPEAHAALIRFKASLDRVSTRVRLRPGMMLLVNNRIASHGRSGFEPNYTVDGAPLRWLQRVFWMKDLARLADWSEAGRVFTRPEV